MLLKKILLLLLVFLPIFHRISADDIACAGCTCKRKGSDDWSFIGRFMIEPDAISSWSASSFLLEAGSRHFRGSGTLGLLFGWDERLKLTGEWLIQKNSFGFSSEDSRDWINQGALGIQYQHFFCNPYILSLDIGGSYSHSFGKQLDTKPCSNQSLVKRFIAGSNAYDVSCATIFPSWGEGFISVFAVYDLVRYETKYFPVKEVKGIGGGARLFQPILSCVDFIGCFEFRQPYNYFEADLNWKSTLFSCDYSLGIFASYTDGKRHLTNDGKLGIQLFVVMGEGSGNQVCRKRAPTDFITWVQTPAVYRPKVLAIKDQDCVMTCAAPTTIMSILEAFVFAGEKSTVDASAIFFGSTLSYSLVGDEPLLVTIDPTTGILKIPSTLPAGEYHFTVKASNQCGQAKAPVILSVINNI